MADNKLEIIIGGENKGALSAIDAVTDALDKLPSAAAGSNAAINKLEKSLGPVIGEFQKMKIAAGSAQAVLQKSTLNGISLAKSFETVTPSSSKLSTGLTTVGKSSNSAALALGNLGRVAQDAPFGFIGISNNLNPLLESFQRLKAETGSSGAALKALGGSLLGAGGIGLALSAITAAITFAQMGLRAWGVTSDETKEKSEELAVTTERAKSQFDKTAESAQQLTTELVSQRNAYELLTKSVFDFTDSLAKEVEIKSFLPLVEGFVKKIVDAKIELNKLNRLPVGDGVLFGISKEDFEKESAALNNIIKKNTMQFEQAKKGLEFFAGGSSELFKILGDKAKETKAPVKDLSDFVQKLRIDLQGLQAQEAGDPFAKIKESTAELTNAFFKLKKDGKLTAKDIIDAPGIIADIEQAKTDILSAKLLEDAQATSAKRSAENWAAVYKAGLASALKDIVPAVPSLDDAGYLKSMQTMLAGIEQAVASSIGRTKQQIDNFATGVTAIVQQIAGDLVGGLAEGIGNALSGVKNPFGSILKVLGDGLVTLGKFVIQSYITLEALKKLLATAGIQPAVGIAIGAAMVALGTVIRNKVNQTKFAEGGIISGPLSAQIGEAGQSEVVMPLSRLSSIMRGNNGAGQVVFQISGQNLVGVLNRGTASLNRTFR